MEKWNQDKLEMETAIRQRDAELGANKIKKPDAQTHQNDDPLQHNWPGVSLGPEVMQGKKVKETPMTAAMETPDESWEQVVEEIVDDWVNHVSQTGRKAPDEYIVNKILAHNFRQLVENKGEKGAANIGRFKYLSESNKVNPCVTPPR